MIDTNTGKEQRRKDVSANGRQRAGRPPAEAAEDAPPPPPCVPVSAFKISKVSWLWKGYIPLGGLTILDADPGMGKTSIALDLAARVSKGTRMPDKTKGVQGGVLLLSNEDNPNAVIRPRLEAAGADADKVFLYGQHQDGSAAYFPQLPACVEELAEEVRKWGVKLIVIDPLYSYLADGLNANNQQDVRKAIDPLSQMSQKEGIAILCIRHLNKSTGQQALHRGSGSIGTIAAARSALLAAPHPEDPGRRVLAVSKSNVGARPPSLAYSLVPAADVARVKWHGPVGQDADELLTDDEAGGKRDALDDAKRLLRDALADGPKPAKDLINEAKDAAISGERTLRTAKKALGVRTRPRKKNGKVCWEWWFPKDG